MAIVTTSVCKAAHTLAGLPQSTGEGFVMRRSRPRAGRRISEESRCALDPALVGELAQLRRARRFRDRDHLDRGDRGVAGARFC